MAAEYNTERTSQWTAQVRDVQISIPKNPGTEVTRRVARMQLVDNAKDSEACVKVTLLNQKRRNPNEPWQDPEFFNAVKLKRGEQIRFHLSAGQAKRLYVALRDMYEVGSKGLPEGRRSLRVVDSNEAVIVTGEGKDVVSRLIEKEGDNFFDLVSELEPDLFEAAALTKVHRRRRAIVDKFEEELQKQSWSEEDWEQFFRENS